MGRRLFFYLLERHFIDAALRLNRLLVLLLILRLRRRLRWLHSLRLGRDGCLRRQLLVCRDLVRLFAVALEVDVNVHLQHLADYVGIVSANAGV